ncbi:MAG: Cobyric acid synthase [Candidatus Argoarchaeum ethanivorans]|uniref:Probable cobyric acid synthase n=1 Tax=Candidatus Argoarchaeum ethanivorans TaxID=2608793 RepID=A0A811T8J6_9EURY|nr:MAG: Cobyric acid synthase [Candidatus Argoarchaeum ethanivorans]
MAKPLMILGTSSHVGKSIITAGICRILAEQGYSVAPFKAQNMSLNSWITRDGSEIGMAQAVQAHAAGIEPTADMNPVLLKPRGDKTSQVIVLGKIYADKTAGDYYDSIHTMTGIVKDAYTRLSQKHDFIIIEGAGGAAEINLYDRDIVNIGTARTIKPPIILVGDIERGGVFASIHGTIQLLPDDIKPLIKCTIINKFRGDLKLLQPGIEMLEKLTSIPVLGVLPYTKLSIPSEDSVSIKDKQAVKHNHNITIAVIRLSHISNFTDFEPLEEHAIINYIEPHEQLKSPDAIIIPGTKNTIDDLRELQKHKMDLQIKEHAKTGTPIIGICGGYQMLGKTITDKSIESTTQTDVTINGLNLINAHTTFEEYHKYTKQVTKTVTANGPILGGLKGTRVKGYEIHMGTTAGNEQTAFTDDGCTSKNGLVIGTYLHGLFENADVTNALLKYLHQQKNQPHTPITQTQDPYTNLAKLLQNNLQMNKIYRLLEIGK